jgi:hypothetical protein
MPQWTPAGSVPEVAAFAPEPTPVQPPRSRRPDRIEPVGYDDEEDEDAFDRPRRRRRRRPEGMSTGAKIAIGVGVGVLVLLIIGGIWLVVLFTGEEAKIRTFNLRSGAATEFRMRFEAGKKAEVWVKSDFDSDVDLFIIDAKGRQILADEGPSKDCYLQWVPPETQTYTVRVVNRVLQGFGAPAHRNRDNRGTVTRN